MRPKSSKILGTDVEDNRESTLRSRILKMVEIELACSSITLMTCWMTVIQESDSQPGSDISKDSPKLVMSARNLLLRSRVTGGRNQEQSQREQSKPKQSVPEESKREQSKREQSKREQSKRSRCQKKLACCHPNSSDLKHGQRGLAPGESLQSNSEDQTTAED